MCGAPGTYAQQSTLHLRAAKVSAMAERWKRLKEAIDWARRIHWIYLFLPTSWKAYVVALCIGTIAWIVTRISHMAPAYWYIGAFAAIAVTLTTWAAIERRQPPKPEIKPRPSRIAKLQEVYPSANGTLMLLLPFRNDSVIGQDRKFYAHIVYKRSDGSEITDVAKGSWFPTRGNPLYTSFETGATSELAVLFLEGEKLLKPTIQWLQQTAFRQILRWPDAQHDEIAEPIHTVEVTLLSGTHPPLPFLFGLTRTPEGQPILKWRR